MLRILKDRAGLVLLLSVGSISTGIDAVDVLGMIQSTLVSIDDSTTDCLTQLLILWALPLLFSFLEIPSLWFAALVFLLSVSRPFSTFVVQITNESTLYIIEMHAVFGLWLCAHVCKAIWQFVGKVNTNQLGIKTDLKQQENVKANFIVQYKNGLEGSCPFWR